MKLGVVLFTQKQLDAAWMCIRQAKAPSFTRGRMPHDRSWYEAEIFGRY